MVTFPTPKKTYEGEDMDSVVRQVLIDNIIKNRKFAHKPYPEDYNLVYNYVFKQLNGARKSGVAREKEEVKREERIKAGRITFMDSLRGAKAILNMAVGDVVEAHEMARRAVICSQCPLVTNNTDCASCKMGKEVTNIVNSIRNLARRSVNYPTVKARRARDMNCGYCGCSMLMVLPAKISCFNEAEHKNENRPDPCWIKRGGINYIAQT